MGSYLSAAATTLSEVKAAPYHLPMRTLVDGKGVLLRPVASLPSPLIDVAAEIGRSLSACKRPILVSGSDGSGKMEVLRHLAASLGLVLQQVLAFISKVAQMDFTPLVHHFAQTCIVYLLL